MSTLLSDPAVLSPAPRTYLEATRAALDHALTHDPSTLLLGEDIGAYGGAFKLTEGMLEAFGPERVIDTPIAEGGIIGAAIGLALMGRRPIVEMQFMDFISCGFNQLTNFAAKCHYRWGARVPLVVRGPGGGLVGGGPFHSQSVEVYLAKTAGLKVVAPATAEDAYALTLAAINDPDPVVVIEHKALYRAPHLRAPLPSGERLRALSRLGEALTRREGRDLTLITYGAMVHRCLEAAERLAAEGVEAAVLDLRTLSPLDEEAIALAVKRTHRALVVHEDTRALGLAGEVAAVVNERAFEWLDAPVGRLTAPNTPVPYHAHLEAAFAPQVDDIRREALALARY
ncbi:MAG: alpha-ketoacid dehydrogenase subunit beta [Deltaproteobacteria bacterium]|nr:alpha-ketoacid dehydrogenase subunit beta [Deltaproteobacteria bacterium]